jgi:hypothetical protein
MFNAELPKAANITIYSQVPEGETCDTMWADCESPATLLIVQELNGQQLIAWRCDKHHTD